MPKYALVTIGDAIDDLSARAQNLKAKGTYNADLFDSLAIAEVMQLHKTALKYIDDNATFAESHRSNAQKAIEMIEKLLKGKTFDDKSLKGVEQLVAAVGNHLDSVRADTADLAAALVPQYRASWPGDLKLLLSDPAKVAPFESQRKATIDQSSMVKGMTVRLEEYKARGESFLKLARTRRDETTEYGSIKDDLIALEKSMETHQAKLDALILKARSSIDALKALKNKKPLTAADKTTATTHLPKITSTAKQVRGGLKTMTIEHDTVMKRGKATPGFLQGYKDSLKKSDELLKAATASTKAFDTLEKELTDIAGKVVKAVR